MATGQLKGEQRVMTWAEDHEETKPYRSP